MVQKKLKSRKEKYDKEIIKNNDNKSRKLML